MEKVLCGVHGNVCMLKTGVKDGPSKNKSFYVCVNKPGCDFNQQTSISPSHCLLHENSVVELQALSFSQQHQNQRLFYRCSVGKKSGLKWCGNVPWTEPEKDKRSPTLGAFPPVRNPFKAPGKTNEELAWRKMQNDGQKEKKNVRPSDEDARQKENVEIVNGADEKRMMKSAETYRGKRLPEGMKVKKNVSCEDGGAVNVEKTTSEILNEREREEKTSGDGNDKRSLVTNEGIQPSLGGEAGWKQAKQRTKGETKDAATSKIRFDENVSSRSVKAIKAAEESDEDDVVLVSVKPAVQTTITSFPGFQSAANRHKVLTAELKQKKTTLASVNVSALPDKGERLKKQVKDLEEALESLSLGAESPQEIKQFVVPANSQTKPFSQSGGSVLPAAHQASSSSQLLPDSDAQTFYGGRMTNDRLLAVKNATCEAIDHLHKSLESCPSPEAEAPDPEGIKVPLLPHQKKALAWLLWRETQNPCGGILADDMGLGKTLTMISLMLTKKTKSTKEEEKKKNEIWISKSDSRLVVSKGTLIICPASLIHHWKKEIERHVKSGRLSMHLYHGANRQKSARVLADYDVVVTTYSLVSKEIPVQAEEAENPSADPESVPSGSAPLQRIVWARVVLDEAHNIKNPKVQTSVAVCQLRAGARWAVTGTPIQNNLLDIYSLLKFLRCSPFDEYKLWKAQVDNGSSRGRERLDLLTKSLLLRRTKTQTDSEGKPLVSLPARSCEVHWLKLSEDERAIYDVMFAQSRSTLQNYLKKHEGSDPSKRSASSLNPFDKVAQDFAGSQPAPSSTQAASTIHILSLLLRLRQSCCHPSLLKKTLDSSELQGDGVILTLEEQLNALSLSSGPDPAQEDSVSLHGTRFPLRLFEETSKSTKISALTVKLNAIREKKQKSVIVSQWTSMLCIVAVHLRGMGFRYAVIDGTVNPKRRIDLVEEFNTNPKGPQVMLVSLCAGGVGLNLTGGNHLFLIDMHWNPALEDQACDRIYRVGQSRDVTIHRFVCEETVEEKISTLQEKKKELAQNVLSGTGKTLSKLSLADLRIIFGV